MSRVYLGSPGSPLSRARVANSTNSGGFPALAPTTTKPLVDSATGATGVVDLGNNPPRLVKLIPFGVGANNTTFDVRLTAWHNAAGLWVPTVLLQFTATLSAAVGVAGATVLDTERFADTLGDPTTNFGVKGTDCWQHSPQNDTPGFYLADAAGGVLYQVDTNLGTATSGNALIGIA